MKYITVFISIFATLLFINCGSRESKSNSQNTTYDVLYRDSFDILLHKEASPYTLSDTVYVEMYLALKAMRPGDDGECARMVCEKVEILMKLDTIKENQIHYLEAKQIAQSALKDLDGFKESAYRQYNLYPKDSYERLGSLGSLFLSMNQHDSAEYYLNRCVEVSKKTLHSSDSEEKEKSILGVIHGLILLNKDQEAKSFLEEQLKQNDDEEIIDFIRSFYDNFDNYKEYEWRSVKEFHFK